ncbi:MAG: 23S rRNA (adenine(2503)-C(2))-methyltransferase RlmN [Victivallaceae bacterium]|nr:23S rRNA (adenine(2503)-C(2))-methyltransferase RlmN [Victivallaceae bacterium]
MKPLLSGLRIDGINALAVAAGEPPFRARQLTEWVYKKLVLTPEKMHNLPTQFKNYIRDNTDCGSSVISERSKSGSGTEKLLLTMRDGNAVEMVIIPSPKRVTFCLSTQIGCPVRCRFCASGADGLVRNLLSGEIIEQLWHGSQIIGRLPDNIVFMGIGEGLLNFDHLAAALDIISSPDMIGLSPRRIVVSTSGYVPGIRKLAELGKPFTLAVSLHAVNDTVRAQIIPSQLRYSISEILEACTEYRKKIGRMITFEYTLLAGINDDDSAARQLAEIAHSQHAKINLIPYNDTGSEFKRPTPDKIRRFQQILESCHANVTLRVEKGSDANAACGQLRRSKTQS